MTKNKRIKKYNQKRKKILSLSLIILLGVFVVFLSMISTNSKVNLRKTNSTEGLNKNKNTLVKGGVLKITQKDVEESKKAEDKTSDIDKKKELEIIRGEVEKSKYITREKEINTKDVLVKAANKRLLLIKVHGQLKNAYSLVESQNEKQVIAIMISTVGKLETNPSYDFKTDQASIKSTYNKLDANSKSNIKNAILCNIDGDSITQLKKSFGL
ncbi:hypothetical protein LL037_00910 [Clostridium estertheticum]|uniref:Uncharacterized protein n=1 Tax=Clostridium estertheticum TaxID=238834 RepID=A0AA47I6Q3_9CLOT|nr:hypothetical protein [Clostridium estertheticum]MBU3154200.1 hypothetical protein [Clostridium estertheticum]MBU3198032.1 hypothetical protein [Clostridium estertheticum]WAG60095.1 hypothetical protein LL038_21555 [Clostridium estertheticum]WAG65827.1 hypothetical protein LL037_00910 [Clostridium estertheticum]